MGRSRKKRKLRREEVTSPVSNTSASDNSVLECGLPVDEKSDGASKITELTVSTPLSVRETLSRFKFLPTDKRMSGKGDNRTPREDNSGESLTAVTNEDLMYKLDSVLCEVSANGNKISKLSDLVDDLHCRIFQLEQENNELREQIRERAVREDELREMFNQTCYIAKLADKKSEDTAAYVKRNNLRIYGVKENSTATQRETQQQCENLILNLIKNKLQLDINREDIDAVHRLGLRQNSRSSPRGIIVRFVSRRIRDHVIYARRRLSGTGVVIVEDLTPRGYALLTTVKDDKEVCHQAWSKNGRVFMKALSGEITHIDSLSDLRGDQVRRQRWAARPVGGSSRVPDRRPSPWQKQQGNTDQPQRRSADHLQQRGAVLLQRRDANHPQPRGADQSQQKNADQPQERGSGRPQERSADQPRRRSADQPQRRSPDQLQRRSADQPRRSADQPQERGADQPQERGADQLQQRGTTTSARSRDSSSDSAMSTGGIAHAGAGVGHSLIQPGKSFSDSVVGIVDSVAAESSQTRTGTLAETGRERQDHRKSQELTILQMLDKSLTLNMTRESRKELTKQLEIHSRNMRAKAKSWTMNTPGTKNISTLVDTSVSLRDSSSKARDPSPVRVARVKSLSDPNNSKGPARKNSSNKGEGGGDYNVRM